MIVGPMVYFFPAGLKTFLDSFVMLVGLPVLSGVFGGFFFNCLPKYSARVIMVFHIICYGGFMLLSPSYSLFGGNEGSIHYLYAVSILWPLEMLSCTSCTVTISARVLRFGYRRTSAR